MGKKIEQENGRKRGRIDVSTVVQARAAGSGLIAKLTLIIGRPLSSLDISILLSPG